MKQTIQVHMVQMTSAKSAQSNMAFLDAHLESQDLTDVDIVVIPEMFAQFGVADQKPLASEEVEFNGPIGAAIRRWAQLYQVWIVAGTIPVMTAKAGRPVARCHVVSNAGEVVSYYDKIHLFDAVVADKQGIYKESDSYSPGSTPIVFDSPWGRIGLAVCYDLRFPELFRTLNDLGAEVVILPSAFTEKTGAAHWEVLCRARAIENQFFLVAVNQCGHHDSDRKTWGHSMLVDPWGEIIDMGSTIGGRTVTIARKNVDDIRQRLPVNQHRRLGSKKNNT